ncbi:MAG: low temperature requirement protein A [Proteobacteria bacterium]|nr:low temperature requirement protein A [Pseudomonadota bacterium]
MQNRWFHLPKLHTPAIGHTRRVGWLELFYDLIYVATILQLGNALSEHVSMEGFLAFAALFTPIWMSWQSFTVYSNRFVVDDLAHRSLVFLQMAGIGLMAVSVPAVLEFQPSQFVAGYSFVLLIHAALYLRVWIQVPQAAELGQRFAISHALRAALWFVSLWVPSPWSYGLWFLAILVGIGNSFSKPGRELSAHFPNDFLHLSERYGLLTLIVLGESFMKVLSALYEQGYTHTHGSMAVLGLVVTCGLWWLYFDDIAGSRLKRSRLAGITWTWMHLPLTIGITAVGVSIKKVAFFDPWEPASSTYAWLFAGSVALVFTVVGILDTVTERRESEVSDLQRVRIRFFCAAGAMILAAVAGGMPAVIFTGLIAFMMVAQVFFDLFMAPMADPEAAHHEDPVMGEAAPVEPAKDAPRRISVGDAVRKGVPNDLRSDLFYLFLEGSWTALFTAMVTVFVISNAIFGALYLLDPGSVTTIEDGNFTQAFSFSVQTMATIGYGVMAPVSTYAHVLVWVEAFLGIVGTALFTGLVLAKAARPSMKALFSENVVIHQLHGQRTLSFRVGNARGNEIVEASMNVALLLDEVSPEGHELRRLADLKLTRSFSPMFSLSWSVFHPIDEDSPLFGMTEEECDTRLRAIICTMTGHDGTYGQTVHARHLYNSDKILEGYSFVDVISTLPDGRIQVDFTKFHDVERVDG